jgi:Zn-dependent M28 family amino/carboxypeptidase
MAANPYLDVDKTILAEIYTSSEPMDNLLVLCDEYGSRFPGTPGDRGSVEYMVGKLKSYGFENAHFETFKIPGWIRGKATLTIIEPVQKELDCISLPLTLAGTVEANLVDLGAGPIDIYEKRKAEIEGNIAMVSSRNPAGMPRSLHRTEKFFRSILAGAKGFIFVNQYPAYGPQTGGVSPIIPSIGISYEDGEFLARLLKRKGKVKIRLKTMDKNVEQMSYNVVADIPGTSKDEEYALVGAHYEGHDIAQGAIDSGSGAATVIEMARVLNKVRDQIKKRIRFVCFGVEEIGLFGSRAYVEQHTGELDKLRFMLNLDSAGGEGRKGVVLNNLPEVESLFRGFAEEMKAEVPIGQRVSPYSDHWPFFLKGVPTASGGDPEPPVQRTGRGYGHTRYDTADKADLRYLRDAAANYSRLIFRIANADEWPAKHKTEEKIKEFVKAQGYEETVALADKVKEYVSKWKKIPPDTKAWIKRPGSW